MSLKGSFGGISCVYHVAEIFRVFISPESVNDNYTVSGMIIYLR